MTINYGYFDSVNGDRKYDADTMSRYFSGIISRGVLQGFKDGLQVIESTDFTISIKPGKAFFSNGKWVENNSYYNITIDESNGALSRIDRIVLRCDTSLESRNVSVVVKQGTYSSNPVAPEMTSDDYIEELSLCQIYVPAGATAITQAEITDERPNDELCGFVHQLFDQVSTTDIYAQYESEFNKWLSELKDTVATTTIIRQYTSSYITAVQDQTEIPINIPQYNPVTDMLNVYINGLKLIQDVNYTKSNNNVVLTKPVDTNTQIEFEVLKSVDGTAADTVVTQVNELQNGISKLNKYNYYCNGLNDNRLLTELCESYFASTGVYNDHNSLTINVIGKFGIDTTIVYTGEETKTYSASIKNTSNKNLCIDFANCDTVYPMGAFLYVQNVTIKNLSIRHNNNVADVDINSISGLNAIFDGVCVKGNYSGGICTSMNLEASRALNCTIETTSNGLLYGFSGSNSIMDNCSVAVTSTGGSAYGTFSTNSRANNCNFKGTTTATATDTSGNGGIGGGSFSNCVFEGFGGLKGHGLFVRAGNLVNMSNCVLRGYAKTTTEGVAVGLITPAEETITMFLHGINCNQVEVSGYSQLASMTIAGGYGVYDGLFYTTPTIYNDANMVSHGAYNRNRA